VHGEAVCVACGTPYQLCGDVDGAYEREINPPRCNIKPKWIPILREYWNETRRWNGQAVYLLIRSQEREIDAKAAFNEWVTKKHPELCETESEIAKEHGLT